MYPLRFDRICRKYVWGTEFWELSDRSDAQSVVVNGPWKGLSLRALLSRWKEDLVGVGRNFTQFPLLIKTITAKDSLSLQVHPDEKRAAFFNGEPKSESWVMLGEGKIYAGLKRGTTRSSFLEAIRNNTVVECVESKIAQQGDAFYIPAGIIHAIGGGARLLEVQQNSNTTYRLYDWGRSSRPLHIQQALEAIDWDHSADLEVLPKLLETEASHRVELLVESPHFIVERVQIGGRWNIEVDKRTCQVLVCLEGEAILSGDGHSESLAPSTTYLLPAAIQTLYVDGACQLIRIKLP